MKDQKYIITGGRILLPDGISDDTDLLISGGKIAATLRGEERKNCRESGVGVIDAAGLYVSPGFTDVHQHGGGGSDYMDDDPDAVLSATEAHLAHGTTSVMPTLLSADRAGTLRAVKRITAAFDDPRVRTSLLGIHIEGPYLSPAQSGAQKPENIRTFDPREYCEVYEASEGRIKRWSVAPELDGAEGFARFAAGHGIALSIAHSDADFDTVKRAFSLGFTHMTHFYSCLSGVTRRGGFRVAGAIEAGYCIDGMHLEIIADGAHLPESLVGMIMKFKKSGTVSAVTDAMRAAGQNVTESFLGGRDDPLPVVIEDGVAKMLDRKAFAGSIATSDRLVRTLVSFGTPLAEAVKTVSVYPLRALNVGATKGEIREGFDADLCFFDDGVNVKRVIVGGETVVVAQ